MIREKERWNDVDFLPDSKIKIVGSIGGTPLALVGYSKEEKEPVLSRCRTTNPSNEDLYPCYLHELMKSQDPINLSGLNAT